jgi:DNA-binding CsgD family transcriptional regulator
MKYPSATVTDSSSALRSAQLQVVLPGTRPSFRSRVIEAMRSLVPAPAAFFCLGTDDARAYADATRLVGPDARPVPGDERTRLSVAFGFDPKSVAASPLRVYTSGELWPEAERAQLPYFKGSRSDGLTQALLLFLHEGGPLFGLAGLERRPDEAPFTEDDKRAIEELAPFVVAGARSQLRFDELAREAAALRVLGRVKGAVYVVDRDEGRVLWAADRQAGLYWEEDVRPVENQLVTAVEEWLTRDRADALPSPMRLPSGTVVAVARLEGDPVFGGARCAAVSVEVSSRPDALESLSRREREVARLLVAGYSGVNVAAISGLSEHTVKTYVRRLYTKLGVNRRADLVRKLVAPPSSGVTSSQLTPEPDSSVDGRDDVLD